jgi:hypothetical protein
MHSCVSYRRCYRRRRFRCTLRCLDNSLDIVSIVHETFLLKGHVKRSVLHAVLQVNTIPMTTGECRGNRFVSLACQRNQSQKPRLQAWLSSH